MSLPTPYTLRVRERVAGPDDEFGNPTATWSERDWPVSGIAPGSMSEPDNSNRDLSLVVWSIVAPAGGEPSAYGQVRLPGDSEWYEVDGTPSDWTRGPWPHSIAGVVVELRRADG